MELVAGWNRRRLMALHGVCVCARARVRLLVCLYFCVRFRACVCVHEYEEMAQEG